MTTAKRWSYISGERGRNRVRVFEDGGRPILAEYREGGVRKRLSLGHRDRDAAKRQADEIAAAFGRGRCPQGDDITLQTLFDNYVREVTPAKSLSKQRHDKATTEMLLRFLGPKRKVHTLNRRDWDRFIRARREGTIAPLMSSRSGGVKDRQIEYDLKFLTAVLNWATRAANESGHPLLLSNPLRGLPLPKEESPSRTLMTQKQYSDIQKAASEMDWRFRLALTLVHETGHRIGAVRTLRWSDINLDAAAVTWRAENDKIGFRHVTPLSAEAVRVLRAARRQHTAIGDALLFPSPGDPGLPCSRFLMQKWWNRARAHAGLTGVPRLGWHSLRRKFASELKDTPLKDLCELGGWRDPQTVLKSYQRPDEHTMRSALNHRKAL